MRPSLRFLALAALATALVLAPAFGAADAAASDAVTVPDVGGMVWQDAVAALQGVGLVAQSGGDGVVVPQVSTIADQCPRAGDTVPPGSTVTLTTRTTIADCAAVGYGGSGSGGGAGGGGATGAVAMWPLDESSGTTAADATGTGHDGTYEGAVTLGGTGAPQNGNAAAGFSGGDVTVPYGADLNPAAYTVEAWVNPAAVNTYADEGEAARPIVCSRDDTGVQGYLLYADNYTGVPQFAFAVGAGTSRRYVYDNSGTPEQTGQWYHVAAVFDGTNLHLYVNGVDVTSAQLNDGDGTTIAPNPSVPLLIGNCTGGTAPWQGAIQDVSLWNTALPAATIAQHASGGTPPPGGGTPPSGGGSGGGSGGSSGGACDPSDPRCVASAAPARPLILIPGTLGSYIGNGNDSWWPGSALELGLSWTDSQLNPLECTDSGNCNGGPMPGKGVGGLVGEIKVCLPLIGCIFDGHHYDVTVAKLEDMGYRLNQTLFTFPYDWRESMLVNGALLHIRIEQILQQTHASSVDLLAHSQGGLVVNEMLHDFPSGDVHRVVTVATPYLGAAKFLGILQYKEPCEIEEHVCLVDPDEAAKLTRNFPGALELLPSRRYWDVADSPLIYQTDLSDGTQHDPATYDQMLARLAEGGQNMTLIGAADTRHRSDDQFPASSTPILRIAGVGKPTIASIVEEQYYSCVDRSGNVLTPCRFITTVKNHLVMSGDGTVNAPSAELRNCRTGANLDTSSNAHSAERTGGIDHDGLIHDDVVLAWAVTFFNTGAVVPPCGSGPSPRTLAATSTTEANSMLVLHTTGPLVGNVTDGNATTGIVDAASGLEADDIPGSSFFSGAGSADYAVSTAGPFVGAFTATTDGTVSLALSQSEDDTVVGSAITPPLDVHAGAVIALMYAEPQDLGLEQVAIDDNGDGTVDRMVPFEQPVTGPALDDATPPTATVAVTRVFDHGKSLVRVVVNATDTGGAGVGSITWQTTTGLSGTYTGPLLLPAQGDVAVVATDRAGNVEVHPAWGVLDDRTGVPYLVTSFPSQVLGLGNVDYSGDVDYWGIHSDGGRIRANLAGLLLDARLELDDTSGNALAASEGQGLRPESIDLRVPAGNYLLKVTAKTGGAREPIHPYVLTATTTRG